MGQPAEKNHQENCQVRDSINAKLFPKVSTNVELWKPSVSPFRDFDKSEFFKHQVVLNYFILKLKDMIV